MKYDFTTIWDRVGRDAIAVDGVGKAPGSTYVPTEPKEGFDLIPMWIADMNFATSPHVVDSIKERLDHPLFGYYPIKDEYYDTIINWQTKRNNFKDLKKEYIGFENGVHGGITSAVQILSEPGDKILLHKPTYNGFVHDVEEIGRHSVYSELKKDEDGIYRMDYEEMDRLIKENNIRLAIFCSPHNPSGRVWEKEELEKAAKVFEENNCYVICDEIWADLVYSGSEHTPFVCLNDWTKERVVGMYAPTKTFNLAGVYGSYHIIYDEELREKITKYGAKTHYNSLHILSMYALLGAYSQESEEWVDELLKVLEENLSYATDFINKEIDGVEVTMPEGTYMLFIDVSSYMDKTGKTLEEVVESGWDYGVAWANGTHYNGPANIRLNLALPLERVKEACVRMKEYIFV